MLCVFVSLWVWVLMHACVVPCGYAICTSWTLCVCSRQLMKMFSSVMWPFGTRCFSETETRVVRRGRGGEEIYWVLRLTQASLVYHRWYRIIINTQHINMQHTNAFRARRCKLTNSHTHVRQHMFFPPKCLEKTALSWRVEIFFIFISFISCRWTINCYQSDQESKDADWNITLCHVLRLQTRGSGIKSPGALAALPQHVLTMTGGAVARLRPAGPG